MTPRRARVARHRCGRVIVRGLDADTAACLVTTDAQALNPAGEAWALLAGRRTYNWRAHLAHPRLDLRESWDIAGGPAGTEKEIIVVTDHSCDEPIPPEYEIPIPPGAVPELDAVHSTGPAPALF